MRASLELYGARASGRTSGNATQVGAEKELRKMEYEYFQLVYKNAGIARACARLEKDVAAIEKSLAEEGESGATEDNELGDDTQPMAVDE